MNSEHLQPAQVAKLTATLGRQLRFLNRLCARMQRLGFPLEDPLCASAMRARDHVQDLYTAAQYSGPRRGIGRAAE